MKTSKITISLLILFAAGLFTFSGNSQSTIDINTLSSVSVKTADYPEWIKMMRDPNANFFETQKAFYKYFENRESSKGSGYKQFKRWEYRMQRRILPDGTIPPADQTFNNFNKYQQSFSGIKSLKNGSNWTELGPRVLINGGGYDGLGRINAIGFHPTDPDIIFIGTPEGGLWYSDDGGITWTTHTDDLPTLGVSSIKINFNNTDIMYIGTGDRIYGSRGMGVMKSTNAGINWEFAKTGMGNTTVNMMVMHETNPDIMIAATDNGIYKTTDGANTWILKTSSSGFTDIEYKPGDMATVYAVGNGKFYRSTDSGETWIRTGTGVLPSAGRFVLGVSAASNNKVYVACDAGDEFGGLFISENSGETFTIKSNSPNILSYGVDGNGSGSISWYCFCIAVAPDDPNIINIGGVNQWLSTDGGDSWTCTGHWTGSGSAQEVHADQHIIEYSATDGKCYIGNDGGIYVSANHGQSWTELSDGLGISQVYKIGQSATLRDKVVNGYQDNGTMTYMGNNGLSWLSTGGGDGMECLVDHSNAAYSYRASQYGPISRYINNSNGRGITGSIDETGEWVTPFCLHETDANTMFIGYKNIWRAKNVKESNTSMINWEQITNNLAGSNSRNINLVEHSPANTKLFYFARGDRTLFRTENIMGTPSWENLTSRMPNNNIPTDLEAHPYDENILYMTQSYRVYKSSDKGNSWENISGSLPNIPMNDIAFDLSSNEGLYVATDAGVYFKEGPGIDWVFYGTGLPANVSINEIEIYQDPESREGSRLRVGTFGRGLWESPLGAFNGILAPAGLNAESGNGIVSLSWKEPFYHDDVSGYNIYRNGSIIDFTNISSYEDLNVENGVSYTYYIKALYTGGEESDQSNSVITTPIPPISLPYTEDFEIGNGAWEYKNSLDGWRRGNAIELNMEDDDGNKTYFFGINSVTGGNGTHTSDYLISPIIDVTNHTNLVFSFDYILRRYMTYDKLYVVYRTSGNEIWTEIEELAPTGKWDSWTNYSVKLPIGAISDNLQLAFYYDDSNEFAWGAAIDNIQLFEEGTGVFDIAFDNKLKIYPNPNDGEFRIEFISEKPSDVLVSIYSLDGKKVFEKNYKKTSTIFRQEINLNALSKGVYQLKIVSDNKIANRKITLQ